MRAATGVARKKVSERFWRTARTAPLGVRLPWDTASVPPVVQFPPAGVGWGPAFVCARAAGVFTRRGVGISGIASSRSACWRFAAGRTRSANNSVASGRKYASSRRPPSGSDASGGARPVRGQRRSEPAPVPPRSNSGAWSRRRKNSAPFCHRPGCYNSLPPATGGPVRYCCAACRQALQRVLDRERKWKRRNVPAGRGRQRGARQARRGTPNQAKTCTSGPLTHHRGQPP